MKKLILIYSMIMGVSFLSHSQNQFIKFHQGATVDTYELNDGDSIYFDASHTTLYMLNGTNTHSLAVASIDSITFVNDLSKNVYIAYNGNTATVTNPLASSGVSVSVSGAGVTVTSTSTEKDINYILSGTTTNGFFKIYSDYRYNVLLNGVSITNPIGPAVNLQSKKNATIHLVNGTSSTFSDGQNYDAAPVTNGTQEDQKGTFFSEGDLLFVGGGNITVTGHGSDQHGIATDEDITIQQGNFSLSTDGGDGIHGSEGFYMNGGQVVLQNIAKDGIDGESGAIEINCGLIQITNTTADKKAIKCDSTFTMNGGEIVLTVSGNESHGIKSKQQLTINGGKITATNSGNVVLVTSGSGYDPSYAKILSSDADIVINDGDLDLKTTGTSGRTISSNTNVTINGGTIKLTCTGNGAAYTNTSGVADAHHSTAIKADLNINIIGGTLDISNSGTGGKGIDADNAITIGSATSIPTINVKTTGAKITITAGSGGGGGGGPGGNTGDYDEAKTVKADGNITINNGIITIQSADDGIKSKGTITINDGELTITQSTEAIEAPYITVNGGDVSLTSSDDGFNATLGTTSGGTESNDGSLLKITGGSVVVNTTAGDGFDSNGNIQITGGLILVHGPQSAPELALDYNGTATISGGTFVGSGPSQQMLEGFSNTSSQKSLILKTNSAITANTLFHVQNAAGTKIFTFKPLRKYATIVFSSPELVNGSYKIYTSGSDSGTEADGYYTGGTYTPGTLKTSFTISGSVTTVSF